MDTEKFITQLFDKIDNKKLDEKQKQTLHDKVLKLELEDILSIFPEVFKAGILDKRDGQALFEELLQRHDRTQLYPLVFDCILEKANFLSKEQLENLKEEVISWAPIDVALIMVMSLEKTKFLGRDEIEHVLERVLNKEHISCYPMAYYALSKLEVFEPEDLEMMWQKTMATGELEECISLAEALKDEDVVAKEDVKALFEETISHLEEIEKGPDEETEREFVICEELRLLNAFADKKMFSPKQIETSKTLLLQTFKGKNNEIEMINDFANILRKNPFDEKDLLNAKKNFMKSVKDAVKTAEGVAEIISSSKKAKKQEPDFQKMSLPTFGSIYDEEFVIDWKNIFSSQDKKTLKEFAIKTKNLDIYEYFVLIWQEGIDELDEFFAEFDECGCDCHECSGCH